MWYRVRDKSENNNATNLNLPHKFCVGRKSNAPVRTDRHFRHINPLPATMESRSPHVTIILWVEQCAHPHEQSVDDATNTVGDRRLSMDDGRRRTGEGDVPVSLWCIYKWYYGILSHTTATSLQIFLCARCWQSQRPFMIWALGMVAWWLSPATSMFCLDCIIVAAFFVTALSVYTRE